MRLLRAKSLICVAIASFLLIPQAVAQVRPQTPQLLPHNTVALVTIPEVQQLLPRLAQTNLGQMVQQPQLEPWAQELYGWFGQVLETVGQRTGVDAREFSLLFQGEVTFALIERAEQPALVILVDFTEDRARVDEILSTLEKTIVTQGARLGTAQVAGIPVRLLEREATRTERLYYVVMERTLVAASHPDVLEVLLTAWARLYRKVDRQALNTREVTPGRGNLATELPRSSLKDHPGFTTVLAECQKFQKERPLLFWFIDPINLLRAVAPEDPNVQFALIMVPILGLESISAIGGAVSAAIGPLDWFTQTHLIISGNRMGALGLFDFAAGDYTPPHWVPEEAFFYWSVNWRIPGVLEAIRTVVDGFRGSGALTADLRRISRRLSVDIENEIIPVLTGRLVGASLLEWPARPDSRAELLGLEVRDPNVAKKLLSQIAAQFKSTITEEVFGSYQFYRVEGLGGPRGGQRRTEEGLFGVVGNWVLVANRKTALQQALAAFDGAGGRLLQAEAFRQLAAKIDERVDPLSLALVTFDNPRENVRYLFELAQTEEGLRLLEEARGRQRLAQAVRNLVERRGLPAFTLVEKFLVPQGSVLITDQHGLHYLTFSFRELPDEGTAANSTQ